MAPVATDSVVPVRAAVILQAFLLFLRLGFTHSGVRIHAAEAGTLQSIIAKGLRFLIELLDSGIEIRGLRALCFGNSFPGVVHDFSGGKAGLLGLLIGGAGADSILDRLSIRT